MKTRDYTKPLLVVAIVILLGSLFFNVQHAVQAQSSEQSTTGILENFVGKQVSAGLMGRTGTSDFTLKEVGADYLLLQDVYGDEYVIPLHSVVQINLDFSPKIYLTRGKD